MSNVFLAVHQRLRRNVAIKLLPKEKLRLDGWLDRFNREMTSIAALEHPNVVRALDAGEDRDQHYLVMEYLEGLDVGKLARRMPRLNVAAACEIVRQAALGLQAIHDAGMVHRDIKPSNLFLTRQGTVKILDLGLVLDGESPVSTNERLTTVGHLMGTLPYMPREQLNDSSQVSFKADLYSLGATLFRLLAGQPPFGTADNLPQTIQRIQTTACPSIDSRREELPPNLVRLVGRLLDHDTQSRPQSAQQVASELFQFCENNDLKRLAHEAEKIADTDSSSNIAPSIVAAQDGHKSNWSRTWLAFALVPFALIGGVLITLATDKGNLVIESEVDGVQLAISQNDQPVQTLRLSKDSASSLRLWAGEYELTISGPESDRITLEEHEVSVFRGSACIVHVGLESELKRSGPSGEPRSGNGGTSQPLLQVESAPTSAQEFLLVAGTPPVVVKSQQAFSRVRMFDSKIVEATPLPGGNRLELKGLAPETTWIDLYFVDESQQRIKVLVTANESAEESATKSGSKDLHLNSLVLEQYYFKAGEDLTRAYHLARDLVGPEKLSSIETNFAENTLQIVASKEIHTQLGKLLKSLISDRIPPRPVKLFQGKTLDHWISVLSVEKDSGTLATAIEAVTLLAESREEMLWAAEEVLKPARRLGGLTMDRRNPSSEFFVHTPESASHWYMNDLNDWFKEFPADIQIQAMANQLSTGTERTALAVTWLLFNLSWEDLKQAAQPPEQSVALHAIEQKLAGHGSKWLQRLEIAAGTSSLNSLPLSSAVELSTTSRLRIMLLLNESDDYSRFSQDRPIVGWAKRKLSQAQNQFRQWQAVVTNPNEAPAAGGLGAGGMRVHSNPTNLDPFLAAVICGALEKSEMAVVPLALGLLNGYENIYGSGPFIKSTHVEAFEKLRALDEEACAIAVASYLVWTKAQLETQFGFGTQKPPVWPEALSGVMFEALAKHPRPMDGIQALIQLFPMKQTLPSVSQTAESTLDTLISRLILETSSDDLDREAKLAFGARAVAYRKLVTREIVNTLLGELTTDAIVEIVRAPETGDQWPSDLETNWNTYEPKPGTETLLAYLPSILLQAPSLAFPSLLTCCDDLSIPESISLCELLSKLTAAELLVSKEGSSLKSYLRSEEGRSTLSKIGQKLNAFAAAINKNEYTRFGQGGRLSNRQICSGIFRQCGKLSILCGEEYSDEFAVWLEEVLLRDAGLPLDDQLSKALPISAECAVFELNAAMKLSAPVEQEVLFKVLRRIAWTDSSSSQELDQFIVGLYSMAQGPFEAFFLNSLTRGGVTGLNGLANRVRTLKILGIGSGQALNHPWQTIVSQLRTNPMVSAQIDQFLETLLQEHASDQFVGNAIMKLKSTR